MPHWQNIEDIRAFFASYARAFEQYDGSAIAEHFAFPLHIVDDDEGTAPTVVPDRRGWISLLERLLEMYRRIELASARFDLSTVNEIAPGLLQAVVNWKLHDRGGHRLYDFTAGYTLKRWADGLRIIAVAHNELSRSRPLLVPRRR